MGINVLSLSDGCSGVQLALRNAKVKVKNYFSSETNKFAISLTQQKFPKTIQLGCASNYKNWKLPHIDFLIGKGDCRNFRNSKDYFDFSFEDSWKFFKFYEIKKFFNPDYFLMENYLTTPMNREIISDFLEVKPIFLNSKLVSAQDRPRAYYTNLPNYEPPDDKKIFLSDIALKLPKKNDFIITKKVIERMEKTNWNYIPYSDIRDKKSAYVSKRIHRGGTHNILKCWKMIRRFTPVEIERLQNFPDDYTEGFSKRQRYKMLSTEITVDIATHFIKLVFKEDHENEILLILLAYILIIILLIIVLKKDH